MSPMPTRNFLVAPSCRKIQPIGDAARDPSARCREEGAHARVAQCGVEIGQAFFIGAREPGHLAKNMLAETDFRAPSSRAFLHNGIPTPLAAGLPATQTAPCRLIAKEVGTRTGSASVSSIDQMIPQDERCAYLLRQS